VERCGYYPNAHARSLASGRSQTLGLVVSDLSNPFFPELVKAIEAAAFERGFDVMLSNTNYDPDRTSHYVRRFIERKVAGVVVMTSELDTALLSELASRDVSVVFLDLGKPGVHMSNLSVNYESGIEEAISHLVSLGHRDIAFVGGPEPLRSAERRLKAFRSSMRRHLPRAPRRLYHGDFKVEGGRRAAAVMLAERDRPTAVLAANDLMALGVMAELRAAGLHIPQDVSVIGFDDIAFAALSEPPLTTICLPRAELGRRAVEALMANVEHPGRQGVQINIPTYLITRASTTQATPVERGGSSRARHAAGAAEGAASTAARPAAGRAKKSARTRRHG
jgi:LacI family transcriptional regulator